MTTLQALQTLEATVGLYALEVRSYVVSAIDAEYGGGYEVASVYAEDHPVLRNATLEQVAAFLDENCAQ